MKVQNMMIANVNNIARIALFSISPLPSVSFLRFFHYFGDRIVPAGMERMALQKSLEHEKGPLYDSEALNGLQSIRGTGRSETAARPEKS